MAKTWTDLDGERKTLRLSRAEMCRRAGISESTVTKGLKGATTPLPSLRRQVELVLAAERTMLEEGLR